VVIDRFETSDGTPLISEAHSVNYTIREAIQDCRTVAHIVTMTQATGAAMRKHADDAVRAEPNLR